MFFAIFSISFLATFFSSMSGAGSGMVTIPSWIFLGYPLPVALAASQINGALWTPVAARNYLRNRELDWKLISGLILFGLVGAYFGTKVVVGIDSALLQRIVGAVILCLVVFASMQKQFGVEPAPPSVNRVVTSLLALPFGFYEAFFGSGNGIFTSSMLVKARGFNLTTALGYYYLISFTWCLYSAFLYCRGGYGAASLIIPSAVGAVAGGYFGSVIGSKRGSEFVKVLFMSLGGVLGLKLALGF